MQHAPDPPRPAQLWLAVFLPFACGYFLSYLFRVVNAVIAPDLVRDIGLDASELGLLTSTYFLTFAAFQLPLGILLDRYGPRRTEAALLLFAAAGAWIFANSDSLLGLTVGRGLIGFGVSACLMAAFKAFVLWFPRERLPQVNGFQMAAGGLGALAATQPVELALGFTDWRGVFMALAGLTLAVSVLLFVVVPEREEHRSGVGLGQQLRGVGRVFGSRLFWRIAPWTVMSQASFLSIQGLWSGPWLRDVAGFDRAGVAAVLAAVSVAMIAGFVTLGTLAQRSGRPLRVAEAGVLVFLGVQLLLIVGVVDLAWPTWLLFGFFGTVGILPYAVLSQRFPVELAGRVNTGLNLLVFVSAFAGQWAMGAVIDLWPTTDGHYALAGYRAAFGMMFALQLAATLWYFVAGRDLVEGRPLEGH
jgi:predicted MFS family arabinose efflux permease